MRPDSELILIVDARVSTESYPQNSLASTYWVLTMNRLFDDKIWVHCGA